MGKTTTCTNHCSQCGQHFHSLVAFDIHHQRDKTGWPVCLAPLDLVDRDGRDRLVALTTEGECRMYADTQAPVTIWTTPQSLEGGRVFRKASEASSGKRLTPSDSETGPKPKEEP